MDILKILEESGKDLYPEDLDFFVTELATGDGYDTEYREQCSEKIAKLRRWLNGDEDEASTEGNDGAQKTPDGLVISIEKIAPKEANPVAASFTPEQLIFNEITAMREAESYKTGFKKYVAENVKIDPEFIDRHYSFFTSWELDAVISVKQMTEDFLEKYFGALNHDNIARYQQFSEAFFIKHFSQLDASIVIEHGKNEWRKKENRSKQLDVFLRLKGIKM